jgi:hypothetical protein
MKVSVDGRQVTLEPDQNLLTDPGLWGPEACFDN